MEFQTIWVSDEDGKFLDVDKSGKVFGFEWITENYSMYFYTDGRITCESLRLHKERP